jgi:hypothetical protein
MLHPGEIGVAGGRHTIHPALVVLQQIPAPVTVVERWVGENIIGLEVRVPIVVERVTVGDLPVDAADREVHLGEAPGSVIRFLAVD